jgi:hypothetical protein
MVLIAPDRGLEQLAFLSGRLLDTIRRAPGRATTCMRAPRERLGRLARSELRNM